MSKKAVIVPNYKWCRVYDDGKEIDGWHFIGHRSRRMAREFSKSFGGTVRKVTKIVYHYE